MSHPRHVSSQSEPSAAPPKQSGQSIFSPQSTSWDQVFTDIVPDQGALPPFAVRKPQKPRTVSPSLQRGRRQAMTAREISAFDEMFNMIFNAVSLQKSKTWHDSSSGDDTKSVDIGKKKIDDLLTRIKGHSRKIKWTSEVEEELDRKKEQIDLCDTDQHLLEWALNNVFAESQRYEAAVRRAIEEAVQTGVEPKSMPALQPATYPHLIALLMRTFRDKYNDPHLALSIFDHARHLSIASYVFGCTTAAYNELIETRWRCFRDLKGVYDALEEMVVNGVQADSRTRRITESLRREVGARQLWEVEDEFGGADVVHILSKIERSMASAMRRRVSKRSDVPRDVVERRKWSNDQDWKMMAAVQINSNKDPWRFDNWDYPPASKTRDVLPSKLTR